MKYEKEISATGNKITFEDQSFWLHFALNQEVVS